jgi:hypothetical protein
LERQGYAVCTGILLFPSYKDIQAQMLVEHYAEFPKVFGFGRININGNAFVLPVRLVPDCHLPFALVWDLRKVLTVPKHLLKTIFAVGKKDIIPAGVSDFTVSKNVAKHLYGDIAYPGNQFVAKFSGCLKGKVFTILI